MSAYLIDHPPRVRQFRDRGRAPTGLIVVHTAESAPDTVADDTGAEGVARFIAGRTDYGSYHLLCDSDSRILLVPLSQAAYGDGTGSNSFAIHISAATQAHRWDELPEEWVDGCIEQMAQAAADAARWVKDEHGITVPARRVTRAQSDADAAGFISHGERDPGRRTDPGSSFPWTRFLDRFAELTQEDDMASPETQAQLDRIEGKVDALAAAEQKRAQAARKAARTLLREAKDDATRRQAQQIIDLLSDDEPEQPRKP